MQGQSIVGTLEGLAVAQRRRCPICGHAVASLIREFPAAVADRPWHLVRCCRCRMVFLHEQVRYEQLAEEFDWSETFDEEARRRDRRSPVARRLSKAGAALKRLCGRENGGALLGVVLRHHRAGRLCDFGCGCGMLLEKAAVHFEVLGIDVSPVMAARARQRVPAAEIHVGPVTSLEAEPASLDVVTMQSYLEHEQHPLEALRVAREALRPGGIVVLKVPNYASWNRRVRRWRWCGYRFPDHCNYFTRRTLRSALERSGFEPLPCALCDVLPTSDNMYLAARKDVECEADSNRGDPARKAA